MNNKRLLACLTLALVALMRCTICQATPLTVICEERMNSGHFDDDNTAVEISVDPEVYYFVPDPPDPNPNYVTVKVEVTSNSDGDVEVTATGHSGVWWLIHHTAQTGTKTYTKNFYFSAPGDYTFIASYYVHVGSSVIHHTISTTCHVKGYPVGTTIDVAQHVFFGKGNCLACGRANSYIAQQGMYIYVTTSYYGVVHINGWSRYKPVTTCILKCDWWPGVQGDGTSGVDYTKDLSIHDDDEDVGSLFYYGRIMRQDNTTSYDSELFY